jgi:hypothetical protein
MEHDEQQDHDIEELKQDSKRFAAMEAQLKLIGRVLMGILASGVGAVGTLIVRWNDLQVDFKDLEGRLHGHEQAATEIVKRVELRLVECEEDLKEVLHTNNNKDKR